MYMNIKRLMVFVVLFILVFSFSALADTSDDNCSGVWNSVKCFLWGDSDLRPVVGSAWWENE